VREWNEDPVEAQKYAMVMVRNMAWRMANPHDNSKQRAARLKLARACADDRAAHSGKDPPREELADLAEQVRHPIPADATIWTTSLSAPHDSSRSRTSTRQSPACLTTSRTELRISSSVPEG